MRSFMQTQKWAEFQKALGAETFFVDKTLVIKYKLPLGKSYLYAPRFNGIEQIEDILRYCRVSDATARASGTRQHVFLRIEPEIEKNNKQFLSNLVKSGFTKINQESQPSKTLILDITKSESDLLAVMHPKTRYNISLAEKKGVEIEIKNSLSQEGFGQVWGLIRKTSARDKFASFPCKYYKKLLEIFKNMEAQDINVRDYSPYIIIFLAKHSGKIIAASLVMFYGETAVYLHGASDYDSRSLMAPFLLQWQAILEAKRRGIRYYDFWGSDEKKWPGVTRFKKGFGGKEIEYIGTWDYVFRPIWYYVYRLCKKLK